MAKWNMDESLDYYIEVTKPQTTLEMVREFVTTSGQTPCANLYWNLIYEELREWEEEEKPALELKELSDLVYVIYGYANARGWDLDEAIRRVHANNIGRMYQPDGTIKRREDGKILKNKDFPKVDLEDLVQ